MAGELNGTDVLLYRLDNGSSKIELVGQLEITNSHQGTPLDVSSKTSGDFVVLMDGELSTESVTISGNIIYNTSQSFRQARADRVSGLQRDYVLDYSDGTTATLTGMFGDMSDALPLGDKVNTSFTLVSSGQVVRV